MPNSPSPDKAILSFQVFRETKKKLQKAAKQRKASLSQTASDILAHATENVELSAEEYEEIKEATRRARHHKHSRAKNSPRKARKNSSRGAP